MAFTVTATPGGPSAQRGVDLLVRVLTNATEAGGANGGGANAAAGTAGGSLTPNFSGSFIAFSTTSDGTTTAAAAAANNTYDSGAGGHLDTWVTGQGHYTGTVTAGTPLTYGAGSTASGADHENWCAYEVPASGGTITVDGSSPAWVLSDTGTTATTASFTPPAGSVLVVMVSAGCTGSGAGATCAISDTSGLGITWTQRATSSTSDNFQPTFVFTGTVPAPGATPQPPVIPARPGRTWLRQFHHRQVLLPPAPPPAPPPPPPSAPPATALPGATWRRRFQHRQVLLPPAAPPQRLITTLAGGGTGYFTDQFGQPILYLQDVPWGLPANAGRWNGGDWRTDISTYLSARSAQGFTCIRVHIFGTTKTGCVDDSGSTWDGINPFSTTNDPTSGLNAAYWQRIDFLLDEAAAVGITVEMTAAFRWDFDTSIFANTWTTTQCTNFGTALGARYRTRPNVLWFFGDDYNGQYDTQFNAIIAAIRAAGDTHKATIEYFATGSTSRRDLAGNPSDTAFSWGGANADYNLAYYYEPTYFAIEFAYAETSPIPVIWGDGFYFGDAASAPTDNRLDRNFAWWALSSGARGVSTGSDAVWQWQSTSAAAVVTEGWFTTVAAKARALVESLPGWYNLLPDTSNVLVTAGRGTRAAYSNQFYLASTDTYVSASRCADGSLALIYMSVSSSITIDQTKMGAGYTATWADPASGALTSTSTGSTYSSSGLGSNSAGGTDWLLILQGPAITTVTGTATIAGAGAVTAKVTQAVTAAAAGAGAVSATVTQACTASLAGAGSVTANASVITAGSTAALAGAGAVAAVVTQAVIASPAGAGSVTAVVTQTATANLAGAGAVTAKVTQAVIASPAGAGSVTATVTETVTASLAGAGAVSDVVTQAVIASLTGAGALTANPAGAGSTANLAGAGAVTALATVAATATAAGAGAVTAAVTQQVPAALSGAGALTAAGQITGTANLTAAAAITAKAAQAAIAITAGAGAVAALPTQAATATAAGAGTVTAVSGTQAAFTVGTLTATTAASATLTAATAPLATLTAKDQRTGGSGG